MFKKCKKLLAVTVGLGCNLSSSKIFADCGSLSSLSFIYRNPEPIYGYTARNWNVQCNRIRFLISEALGENHQDKITYALLDLDTIPNMEYMLWLMCMDMNEYIDDWYGPHSVLVTSYLFYIGIRTFIGDTIVESDISDTINYTLVRSLGNKMQFENAQGKNAPNIPKKVMNYTADF